MKYGVYLILTYAVTISHCANNKLESTQRKNNIDTNIIISQSRPFLLCKEDSLKLIKKFPVEIYYKVVESTKDSATIMDFALDTSNVFKWKLNDDQKEKLKAVDDLTTDDVIAVSRASVHFMSAMIKDRSWFTDENIKKLMDDTTIINNVARKMGGQPINIKLPPLK